MHSSRLDMARHTVAAQVKKFVAMATDLAQDSEQALQSAYHRFYIALRVRQAKLCFFLAMLLVPSCIGLDHFVYPQLAWSMFRARLWCDLAMLPCFGLLFLPKGQRFVRWIDSAPLLFAAAAIAWMIYRAEGALSPYYAGMNIVMAAAILLIPYTLVEAITVCGLVVGCYTAACVLHQHFPPPHIDGTVTPLSTGSTLVNNFYFLAMTALIAITGCHYNSVRRVAEFRLRHELDTKNTELDAKNTELDAKNTELDGKNTELASTLGKLQQTEVQLVQSEKVNALGKLSAGLLHEINNPLNFTFMALQVAEQDASDELKETLADIHQGMSRIRSVIADLRAFAYPSAITDTEEFNVEEALGIARRLLAHELGPVNVIDEQIRGTKARGTKTHIVHVFMNLLLNSVHATKSKPQGRKPTITITAVAQEQRLMISVQDNGTGVKATDLPRLCEPFFTTKTPGEGTGLGLSICHTIVQNHGGGIHISSEEGQWTRVSFDLPLAGTQRMAA